MQNDPTEILDAVHDAVLDGKAAEAVDHTRSGLKAGIDPMVLVLESMIPALEEVGRLFETGEYFVPEMLAAARAMQMAMDVVRPLMGDADAKSLGTFVMGTVAGDVHDIGKNLCNVMLDGAGFKVIDLGVNVPAGEFIDAIRRHQPDAVGMSAFLTTTMGEVSGNIRLIETEGLREGVKILVGGAPVTQEFADEVGADGYAPDGNAAVRVTRKLLGIKPNP